MPSLISNPPFNMKWSIPPFASMWKPYCECELPPESNANYAFVLNALCMIDNRAAMILPNGILTTDNNQETEIRKYLVNKNYIKAVILCPNKMFESTDISTCILLLDKNKQTTNIVFVDMRKTCSTEIREQNGQYGGASHERRTYKKELNIFTDEQMQKAVDAIEDQSNIPEFSKSVSMQTVKENGCNLMPSRYIDFNAQADVHREYSDIIKDLNRIIGEKNSLKITVNESLAKALGLYDAFMMFKESEKTDEQMNQMLKFTGQKIEKENFISISKNAGELKFENKSKDGVSTILMSILSMWKQHIMYLNNQENVYLAELRDALLPDLMSGKIDLSNQGGG